MFAFFNTPRMCLQPPKQSRRQFVPVCAFNPQKRVYESQKPLMSLTSAGKNGKNVFIIAKILSSVLLASALINLRSALLSLRSAGKNGKNVFIGVKSSVANWQARL